MFNAWTIFMQSFYIKEWKLLELQITQTRHHLSILNRKKCLSSRPLKMKKIFVKCAQNRQCSKMRNIQEMCKNRRCVCGQNICYHVAASVFSFNLICNMTIFWKRYSLTFWPYLLGQGCVCGQNICYHVAASVLSFNLICNMTIFWKSLILASGPIP